MYSYLAMTTRIYTVAKAQESEIPVISHAIIVGRFVFLWRAFPVEGTVEGIGDGDQ